MWRAYAPVHRLLLNLGTLAAILLLFGSPAGREAGSVAHSLGAAARPTSAFNCATMATATTLEALVSCVVQHMPRRDSAGFVVPAPTTPPDWRLIVRDLLLGACDTVALRSLAGVYEINRFVDTDTGQSYCVLAETLDANNDGRVDRGWGTLIVNPFPSRELSIQIAHPLADTATDTQGIRVFKHTFARTFLLAGTHRDANPELSTCITQSSFRIADVAHSTAPLFQATVEEIRAFSTGRANFAALQFHGHEQTSCPGIDVYLTHGLSQLSRPPSAADQQLLRLRANLVTSNPAWKVIVPGEEPACSLPGSTNIQGRLLNDVPAGAVCETPASSPSGRFFHIEQKPGLFRDANNWIGAIELTWPLSPFDRIPPFPDTPTCRFFPLTGHALCDAFKAYWEGNGELPVFGFPLSEAFPEHNPDLEQDLATQYFERQRYEHHPTNQPPYTVLLGRLGDELLMAQGRDWRTEQGTPNPFPGSACEQFTVDQRQREVCGPFREYWHSHGLNFPATPGISPEESLALWGLPLTAAKPETNRDGDTVITQWFERARFEWHPTNAEPGTVLLGRVAAELLKLRGVNVDTAP